MKCPGCIERIWNPTTIEEDNVIFKALTCVPVVGVFVSLFQQNDLSQQMRSTNDQNRLIQLIEVTNDYKIASIVRDVILLAMIVASFATGIFSPLGLITAALFITLIVFQVKQIHHNDQMIAQLAARNF